METKLFFMETNYIGYGTANMLLSIINVAIDESNCVHVPILHASNYVQYINVDHRLNNVLSLKIDKAYVNIIQKQIIYLQKQT